MIPRPVFWLSFILSYPSLAADVMRPKSEDTIRIALPSGDFAPDGIEGPVVLGTRLCASNYQKFGGIGCMDLGAKQPSMQVALDLSPKAQKLNGLVASDDQKTIFALDEKGKAIYQMAIQDGRWKDPKKLADISIQGFGPNDAVWIGDSLLITFPIWDSHPARGALVRYELAPKRWKVVQEWTGGEVNGIAWDSAGQRLFINHHNEVLVYKAVKPHTVEPGRSEIFYRAGESCTYMDGMKVTTDGRIVVACFAQNKILVIDSSAAGRFIDLVAVTGKDAHPTNLAIGPAGEIFVTIRNSKRADILAIRLRPVP